MRQLPQMGLGGVVHDTTCDTLVRHGDCTCQPVDHARQAHDTAMAHLTACWEAMDAEKAGESVDSPASAPFCGCEDCTVREVLHAAWPVFRRLPAGPLPPR